MSQQIINTTDTGTDSAKSGFDKTNSNFTELYGKTSNIDNTSDASKPVSTAQQTALDLKENISNKATGFNVVNDILYPTIQAVKTFAEGLLVGLLSDRGSYDASSNVFPSTGGSGTGGSIKKGNLWFISAGGTLGGETVTIGDSVRALVDNPGQTASNWGIIQVNITYVPENQANKATDFSIVNNILYPTIQAVVDYINSRTNPFLTQNFAFTSTNFADSTTYYIGNQPDIVASATSQNAYRVKSLITGTATKLNASFDFVGNGSAESVSIILKNVTANTSVTISSSVKFTSRFNAQYTGFSLAVSAGDELELQIVCPAWATNPTGAKGAFQLLIAT